MGGRGFREHLVPHADTCHAVSPGRSVAVMKGGALNLIISLRKNNNKDNLKINKDLGLKATYCPGTKINGEWQVL